MQTPDIPELSGEDIDFGSAHIMGQGRRKPRASGVIEEDIVLDESGEDPFAVVEEEPCYPLPEPINQKLPLADKLRLAFPFPEIRPVQSHALTVISNSYEQNKRFTVIEAPTGAGKSPLGFAAARAFGQGYYLTSQNSLSTQMMRDFAPLGLRQLKGQSNYLCRPHRTNCESGARLNNGKVCGECPYRSRKNEFKDSPVGVTNYAYLITEHQFVKEFEARPLLVCDEAHNVEREIISRLDIKVTQKKCDEVKCGDLPIFRTERDVDTRRWLTKTFLPALKAQITEYETQLQGLEGTKAGERIQAQAQALVNLGWQINHYLEGVPFDWIAYSDNDANLIAKPLSAANFAEKMLFSQGCDVLLMSATILDFETFTRTLGISSDEVNTYAVPSDFPAANRRIVYWPVGNMGYRTIEETLPRMKMRIDKLLTKWADRKGMIHSHTYRINNELYEYLRRTEHRHRIITHTSAKGDRERAIKRHVESSDPTVLLSPSMTEGLDLKDNLSRFQVITKVPYPFLDPYTRERMSRDPKWYQLQTALTMVQATGRSVRSATDWATTVILDSAFEQFLSRNQHILPEWWKESLEFKG